MRKCVSAILLSLLFHALLAVGLITCLEYAPHPDVLATLDLSSVELSFAEQVKETAAVAPTQASADNFRPPKPKADSKSPEVKLEKPLPPEPGAIKFPEPREDARLKTEDVVKNVPPKDNRKTEHHSSDFASQSDLRSADISEQSNNSQPAPRQARLDAPPRPKRNIRPDYPKGARQRGEQGDVILEIRVNAEGSVDDVKIAESSGFVELDEAAVKAARASKFSPARSGHDPVASTARLKLQFKLK